MNSIAEKVLNGDTRAISRAITLVEDGHEKAPEILNYLYPYTGKSFIIGITGSPGVGKSTLADRLTQCFRADDKKVGVIAVDPTSPFSGGAILGDRLRLQRHFTDPKVFIRSMATRANLGGLAAATQDIIDILSAAGFEIIIVETVGVGQDEVDIVNHSHTTLVVLVPGLGDDIQSLKAGIMEIADIYVVNKADRAGADALIAQLEALLKIRDVTSAPIKSQKLSETLSSRDLDWTPPICATSATQNTGIENLYQHLYKHREYLLQTTADEKQNLLVRKQIALAHNSLLKHLEKSLQEFFISKIGEDKLQEAANRIAKRELSPYQAIEDLLKICFKR